MVLLFVLFEDSDYFFLLTDDTDILAFQKKVLLSLCRFIFLIQARSHSAEGLPPSEARAHPVCPTDGHAEAALQTVHGGAHLR